MKKEPTGRHSRSLWIILMGVASVALALLTFFISQAGHTAVALISLVAILTLLAWRLVQRTQSVVFRHAPIIVGMGVIVIAGSLWQVMQGQGRTRVREILALEANHLTEHLVAFTQTEVMKLVWEAGRPVARMEAPAARRTQWAESFLWTGTAGSFGAQPDPGSATSCRSRTGFINSLARRFRRSRDGPGCWFRARRQAWSREAFL